MPIRRLVDRLVLCPTRYALPAPGKRRRLVPLGDSFVEVWTERPHAFEEQVLQSLQSAAGEPEHPPEAYVLKFPGTGGRAERATIHPLDLWPRVDAEIWHVNPPGYGGSPGIATLRGLRGAAKAVFEEMAKHAEGRPIVLAGNSLGTSPALWLAGQYPQEAKGLLLRNPPPLQALIGEHYSPNMLRPLARVLAGRVPKELDAVTSAALATQPALFVMSGRDRTVPPHMQERIHQAYGGEKQIVQLPVADHADPIGPEELPAYQQGLGWLHGKVFPQYNAAAQSPETSPHNVESGED